MITANEIRINNYYKHKPEWSYRNEDSKEFYFKWEDRDWYALGESMLFMENIEPIELIPEILRKCGFGKIRDCYNFQNVLLLQPETIDWQVRIFVKDVSYASKFNKPIYIKYLHQLQNIHFALTGEELSISI